MGGGVHVQHFPSTQSFMQGQPFKPTSGTQGQLPVVIAELKQSSAQRKAVIRAYLQKGGHMKLEVLDGGYGYT